MSEGEEVLGGNLCVELRRHLKCQMITYAGSRSEVTKARFREGALISHCSTHIVSHFTFILTDVVISSIDKIGSW